MSDFLIFWCAIAAVCLTLVGIALANNVSPGYDACAAKGGVAVRTTTSWVCARLEVIK